MAAKVALLFFTFGFAFLATVSADPDLLQDVCVADLSSGISSYTVVFIFLLILVNYIYDTYGAGKLTCPALSPFPSQHNFFIFLGSHQLSLILFYSQYILFFAYVLMLLA